MSNEIIQKLKHYASHNIGELAKHDPLLTPVNKLVQLYIANASNDSILINHKEARKLIKWYPEDNIGTPFDEQTVQNYKEIGKKLLDIATNPESNNDNLAKVAAYLHPLFSQDNRTVDMSWDLEEYMNWYFKDTSPDERKKYAKKLIKNW